MTWPMTSPSRAVVQQIFAGRRRNTIATSEAVRKQVDARRIISNVAVQGISQGSLHKITPEQFAALDVDPGYQRGETSMVVKLVNVLQSGGAVLDPVTLCKRTSWGKDKHKLWIVDGYQRVCAYQQLGLPFQAMVHESESLDAEKKFFLALNNRRAVSSDIIVKSWTGPSGRLIVGVSEQPSHSLYQRVNFSQGKNGSRLGALILARGALRAAVPIGSKNGGGAAQTILSRLDVALHNETKRHLAEAYLQLIGCIFPKGSANVLVALALAEVMHEKMSEDKEPFPSRKTLERIAAINWRHELPVLSMKFRPVIVALINKAWR